MPEYLRFAVPVNGRRMEGRHFDCIDDEASLNLAKSMVVSYASIEIWRDKKFIALVPGPARLEARA